MQLANKPLDFAPLSATPVEPSIGGGSGSPFAPLYDEITLSERLGGECSLLEHAAAEPLLNELGSSVRSLTATTASFLEFAGGDALVIERIDGHFSLFEH